MENSINEARDLLGVMNSESVQAEVQTSVMIDPVIAMKNTMFEIVKKRAESLIEDEELLAVAKQALIQNILDGKVTPPQLASIINSGNLNKIQGFDSLFSLFKPVPNAQPPLLTPNQSKANEEIDIDKIPEAEREALHKYIRKIME